MKTQTITAALFASALLCAWSATQAGIVPISRVSNVALDAAVEEERFDDRKSGDTFGTFDEGLAYEAGDEQGTHARGSISQESTVEQTSTGRLIGSGNLYAQAFAEFLPGDTGGPLNISGDTDLTVIFRITESAELFQAAGDFGGPGFRGSTSRVFMQEISNADAPRIIFGDNNEMYSTFERNLLLQPGLYRLYASVGAGSSGSSPGDPYSFGQDSMLNFNFEVGQGAPTAIPLPAAAWSGLLTLPVLAGAIRRARRCAQA